MDGENFKGKIRSVFEKENKVNDLIWNKYNFKGLFDSALSGYSLDKTIFYFAKLKSHSETKDKSEQLIQEQRLLKTHLENQGFEVVLSGRVRGQYERDSKGKETLVFKEKGVDVKIAVDMVGLACDKKVKNIVLGSSDSDLQPAIIEVKSRDVEVTYLGFEDNPNKGLTYTTNQVVLIRNSEVLEGMQSLFLSS
ncbi:NYN domain-containing protein [Candidatus Nomurabacteria bacterium]|nr:NYN domain-containing protein [Candidatus Nomurabacteria bacterium]